MASQDREPQLEIVSSPDTTGEGPDAGGTPPDESHLDQVVGTFFEEPGLWPVLVALVLTAATFGAAALVLALEDRQLPAMAAVALLVVMTGVGLDGDRRRGRLSRPAKLVLSIWALSIAGATAFRLLMP